MSDFKPIQFVIKDVTPVAEPSLADSFSPLAATVNAAYQARFGGANLGGNDAIAIVAAIAEFLNLAQRLDREYGADMPLPISDAAEAGDDALRHMAELESWLIRFQLEAELPRHHAVVLGIGLWQMRHGLAITVSEPIVNALAHRANSAASKEATAAAYALTQGFVVHLAPTLSADLERSNPERPWRLLNLNFAITAIRTGDPAMMRYAFDALNEYLPDERAGFYQAAAHIAAAPNFPDESRALIELEAARWVAKH